MIYALLTYGRNKTINTQITKTSRPGSSVTYGKLKNDGQILARELFLLKINQLSSSNKNVDISIYVPTICMFSLTSWFIVLVKI